jgi:hypothetical protein
MGAVERSHATLAARLTPYMNDDCNNWDLHLDSVVFAMNNAVNSSLGYSPFEVVFSQRPRFPMVVSPKDTFQSLPSDTQQYLTNKIALLQEIRDHVKENIVQYQATMTANSNETRKMLSLDVGDYVYITNESNVTAKKLRHHFKGPYVVHEMPSPHMAVLRDVPSDQVLPQPVHIDRLKMAFVRHPEPLNYYKVKTKLPDKTYTTQSVQTDIVQLEQDSSSVPFSNDIQDTLVVPTDTVPMTRPKRLVQKLLRYRDADHVDPLQLNIGVVENTDVSTNVKRILAQRHTPGGFQYLAQLKGEPAQNAVWVFANSLHKSTIQKLLSNPPPQV